MGVKGKILKIVSSVLLHLEAVIPDDTDAKTADMGLASDWIDYLLHNAPREMKVWSMPRPDHQTSPSPVQHGVSYS